jgi:lantibiotic modifying enzyme
VFTSIDICERLAERFSNPAEIIPQMHVMGSAVANRVNRVNELSLANGSSGIALFYAVLNNLKPNSAYKKLCHIYLERSVAMFMSLHNKPLSILHGIGGIRFVAEICSKAGAYNNLRDQLDLLLHESLNQFYANIKCNPSSNNYTYANGLAGILALLLFKPFHRFYSRQIDQCIATLINEMNGSFSSKTPH